MSTETTDYSSSGSVASIAAAGTLVGVSIACVWICARVALRRCKQGAPAAGATARRGAPRYSRYRDLDDEDDENVAVVVSDSDEGLELRGKAASAAAPTAAASRGAASVAASARRPASVPVASTSRTAAPVKNALAGAAVAVTQRPGRTAYRDDLPDDGEEEDARLELDIGDVEEDDLGLDGLEDEDDDDEGDLGMGAKEYYRTR